MNMDEKNKNHCVLVVDDEKSIRTGMGFLIRSNFQHVNVLEASNGVEAFECIKKLEHKPVLVILDIRMPGMDGLKLCECMKEEGVSIKTAILSGYRDFDYAREAIRFGVADYLLKPVNPSDIIRLVKESIRENADDKKEHDFGDIRQVQQIVEKVRSWIHDHLDQEITLQEISNDLHYTPNYLSTLFKKVIGKGFQEYLIECRMRRARHLLKEPAYKIYEICGRVGYNNSKAFSIAFRKEYGITPTEFRKGLGINNED